MNFKLDTDVTKITERIATNLRAIRRQLVIGVGCVFLVTLGDPQLGYSLSDAQKLVAEAWRIVDQSYVDRTFNSHDWFKERQRSVKKLYADVDDGYAEIRTLLALLDDPYTRVLTPSQHTALRTTTSGVLEGGIGLVLTSTSDNNAVVASTPDADTPAGKSNKLKAGDVIVRVDGEEITGLTAEEVAQRIRGNPGTDVLLTMKHPTATTATKDSEYTASIKRAVVQLRTVYASEEKDTHLGVIRVKSFSEHTAADVRAALTGDLAASTGLVLDLRGNPGGAFEGGVDVARMFLRAGDPIVYVVDRNGVTDEIDALEDGVVPQSTPVYVLVDSGTASASEILAGALLDNGRATLVGEKTFGKGVVQTVTPLSDGGAVAVTIARYETPNHIDINKKGIKPNIERLCAADAEVVTCLPSDIFK